MSLVDLPDELIAHLTSYLDYSDTCNLMETSKKNYKIIKESKKDKLAVSYMRFTGPVECAASDINYQEYIFTAKNKGGVANILRECSSVRDMDFHEMDIDGDMLKMLNGIDTKIGSISIIRGSVNSGAEEFIQFCQKYGTCNFKYTVFNKQLWTDNVFIKVLPHAIFQTMEGFPQPAWGLTNKSLMALVDNSEVQRSFEFNSMVTSFTVFGIVYALRAIRDRGIKGLYWNLGLLHPREKQFADRLFNKENGEMKEQFDFDIAPHEMFTSYSLLVKFEKSDDQPYASQNCIAFCVLRPL